MPYTTRIATGFEVFRDAVTGRITLCSDCSDLIRRVGPGTVYRHTDLSAPTGEAPMASCDHCGRSGAEEPADYAAPFQDPEE